MPAMPGIFSPPHYSVICKHLGEGLLVLAVLEGVDEGVDDGRHPREDGGDRVEQGEPHLVVVGHVHQHQRQEADLQVGSE